jgi:hypothetical protein
MVKHIHPAQGINYFFHAIHMRIDGLYVGLQSLDRFVSNTQVLGIEKFIMINRTRLLPLKQ